MKHFLLYLTFCLLCINAAGALYGGFLLMIDPTGKKLQMPVTWLSYTPFKNFFIPGLVLFIVNGVLSCIAILTIIFKHKNASLLIFIEGSLLTTWIIIERLLTQMYHPLQVVMFCIGISLMFFSMLLMKTELFKY